MKKIIFSLLAIAFFVSCADKTTYTITGTVANAEDGAKVTFYEDRKGKIEKETTTVKDGKFELTGQQQEPDVRFMTVEGVHGSIREALPVVLEPGEIEITIGEKSTISGTPLNEKNFSFWYSLGEQQAPTKELIVAFGKENADNILGVYTLGNYYYAFDLDQLKEGLALMPDKYKERTDIKKVIENVKTQEATAVGKKFTDLKGLTPEGKEISLSDYAGKDKLVLIDFWASWCPPCVADMPHLVAAYAKYKDKGFEIVGVSLDSENEKWVHSIKNLGITWPQMSDLKYWESELSKAYGVSSIPHTVLIDGEGTIIEKKIKGKDLDSVLDKLLKQADK